VIQPPIIVDARGELLLFRSAESAAAYLEAIDVENEEYAAAYDSEGRNLELGVKPVQRRFLFGLIRTMIDLVDVRALEDEPQHVSELAGLLRAHVQGEDRVDSPVESLHALVAAAIERFGYTA
jgi:hypothetical protein